jgi:hypothetical protein
VSSLTRAVRSRRRAAGDAGFGSRKDGVAVKTQKERADERRKEKLASIDEQIERGTLVVRKMTKEERKAHPPRDRPAGGRRRP